MKENKLLFHSSSPFVLFSSFVLFVSFSGRRVTTWD